MMNTQQQLIPPGTPCTIQGLQSQPTFNGNAVSIVEFLHDQGRYRVQPMDPNGPLPPVLAIKPQNLQPSAAPMYQQQGGEALVGQLLPQGARFVLQGLQDQPAFNGQHVLVVEYLHDQDRYRVQPADMNGPLPPTLAIRQQNLVPASASAGTRSGGGRSVLQNMRQSMSNAEVPHSLTPRQTLSRSSPMPPMPPEISIPENNDILPVGSTAILHGLKGQPALNGEMVVIDEYVEDEGRYRVSPVDPTDNSMPVLAIKPQNLLPCKDPRRRERNASDASSSFGTSSSFGSQAFGSQHSMSSRSKSKINASMANLKPGSHARLTGLKNKPKLNGHMVRIVEYLRDKDRYRVEPLDVEAFDVCTADLMAIRPKNLVSEDPMHGGSAPLAPGTRAVLINLSGKPAFNGQLVTVVRYMVENGTYEVRPLGRTSRNSAPAKVLFLGPDKLKPAPQSAFWVQMTIKGHQVRLPVSCKVQRDKIGQANVHVMLDAFAGLDQVIPAAKLIMGEDHCDWMDDGEVLAALKASKSQTITLDIQNKEAHAGLKRDEVFISEEKKPAIFEAMVEFELIKPTQKTVQVDLLGVLLVYKLKFPDTAQTKRPPLQKSRSSTSSVMSFKSAHSSKSLHSSSSSRKPRSKKEIVNKSERKESQSVSGAIKSQSVSGLKNTSRRQPLQRSNSSTVSRPNSIKRRQSLQRGSSGIVSKPNSMRHLLVRSNSNERRPQMEPPGSTHIPIRERVSSLEEPSDDDNSFAKDEDLQVNGVAASHGSLKSADPSHSPKSVATKVPKEVGNKSCSTVSMMGDSYASLASEFDIQDLFVHIEAKEKEKQDLEESVQQLGERLSMVQVTCEAANHKLTLLRGGQDSSDVKEGKGVNEKCTSSDTKEICDSSNSGDSDSDSDDDDDDDDDDESNG
jgi:hypothetical protein